LVRVLLSVKSEESDGARRRANELHVVAKKKKKKGYDEGGIESDSCVPWKQALLSCLVQSDPPAALALHRENVVVRENESVFFPFRTLSSTVKSWFLEKESSLGSCAA
jgi:hypothetical protein